MMRRRWLRILLASTAVFALCASFTVSTSQASWIDTEWVSAPAAIGTGSCEPGETAFATMASGEAISGSVLGIDLDSLADVSGVTVSNNGEAIRVDPQTAQPAGYDARSNPLEVEALEALNLSLTGLLQLPLNNDTGVVGQYARASNTGHETGASGYIDASGLIATTPTNVYPDLATLQLSALLAELGFDLDALLPGINDVSLEIGAVAGRASLDGCAATWSGLAESLTREYLAASVVTNIESSVVGDLTSALDDTLDTLQAAVDTLGSNEAILNGITSGIRDILRGISLGTLIIEPTVTAEINLTPVRDLLTATLQDDQGVLTIDFQSGTVTVDTAGLLAASFPGEYSDGLNGQPPNTDLLNNEQVVTALSTALISVLGDWLAQVTTRLEAAIDGVALDIDVRLRVPLLLEVHIGIDTSLAELEAGNGVTVTGSLLGLGLGLDPLGLLDLVLSALTGAAVGDVVSPLVRGVLGSTQTLLTPVQALVGTVVSTVTGLYETLFINGIIAITVNAQNDPLLGGSGPSEWANLPDEHFRVAALRIGVLDVLGASNVRLHLGQGEVGRVCSMNTAPLFCSGY